MPLSASYFYPVNNGNSSQPSKGVGLYDGTTNLELDATGYMASITVSHHKVHEGELYTATQYDADLDSTEGKFFLIQTPAGSSYAHMVFEVDASSEVRVELYESGSYPLSSSQIIPVNYNRVNQIADSLLIWASCSMNSGNSGSLLDRHLLGGGQGVGRTGGNARSEEWILAANSNYLLKIIATNDNTRVNTSIIYYMSTVA